MGQYPRVAMPQPQAIDVMGPLLDMMRYAQQAKREERYDRGAVLDEAEYKRKVGDIATIDSAFANATEPAMLGARATPGGPAVKPTSGVPGPMQDLQRDVAGAPVAKPVRYQVPRRDQILGQLPAHLQPIVQKQFDDADEQGRKSQTSLLALQKAQRDANADANDYIGGVAFSVLQAKGDPTAVKLGISHARDTYKDFPEFQQQVDAFESEVEGLSPDAVMARARQYVGQSGKWTDKLDRLGNVNLFDLANTIADPMASPEAKAQAEETLRVIEQHEADKAGGRATGNYTDRDLAAMPPSDRAAALAAIGARTGAGRAPEKPDDLYQRNRASYADFKDAWNRTHASGLVKNAEGGQVYEADDATPKTIVYEPPPSYDKWVASGMPSAAEFPKAPTGPVAARGYTDPASVRVTPAPGAAQVPGGGGAGAAPPVASPAAALSSPAAAPAQSGPPFTVTYELEDGKIGGKQFDTQAQLDAFLKKTGLVQRR